MRTALAALVLCSAAAKVSGRHDAAYGAADCCLRFGWESRHRLPSFSCPTGYQLPTCAEDVQLCLERDDMVALSVDAGSLVTREEEFAWPRCEHGPCDMLFTCVKSECLADDDTPDGSPPCDWAKAVPTPLSPQELSPAADNMQRNVALRALVATYGASPNDMFVPETPFLGQIVFTLTDPTQKGLDGWTDCDGSWLPFAGNARLFDVVGATFGWNSDSEKFALPDCSGRVLIGSSDEFTVGEAGGSETNHFDTVPTHAHGTEVEHVCCSEPIHHILPEPWMDEQVVFDNRQPFLTVNAMIVARGGFELNGDVGSHLLLTGELVFSASDFVPPNFVPCDGAALTIADYRELFNVFRFRYGRAAGGLAFKVPDCRGKAIMALTNLMQVGECTGSPEQVWTTDNVARHGHGRFEEDCLEDIVVTRSKPCEDVDNRMPSVGAHVVFYKGINECSQSGRFLGSIGMFFTGAPPQGFGPLNGAPMWVQGNNQLRDRVSQLFVWDDLFVFPDLRGKLMRHSTGPMSLGQTSGQDWIDCNDVLLVHKHYALLACGNGHIESWDETEFGDVVTGGARWTQWSWSDCYRVNERCEDVSRHCFGYQFRYRQCLLRDRPAPGGSCGCSGPHVQLNYC